MFQRFLILENIGQSEQRSCAARAYGKAYGNEWGVLAAIALICFKKIKPQDEEHIILIAFFLLNMLKV